MEVVDRLGCVVEASTSPCFAAKATLGVPRFSCCPPSTRVAIIKVSKSSSLTIQGSVNPVACYGSLFNMCRFEMPRERNDDFHTDFRNERQDEEQKFTNNTSAGKDIDCQ